MPYLVLRGVKHYYEWIVESPDRGRKPVMVFVHGWGGSARYWEQTARELSDRFDCLLYDLRGFGRSRRSAGGSEGSAGAGGPDGAATPPVPIAPGDNLPGDNLPDNPPGDSPDYGLDAYAEDLRALLDALNLDRVYLNGHSMGASIVALFLERYPERAVRAVLTCSGIFDYDEKAFAAFYRFGGYVVRFRPPWLARLPLAPRLFMARFLHRPLPAPISRAFLEDFLQADYDAALGTIFTSVSLQAVEEMPETFARLTVPTLLVSGQRDRIIPAELGARAAALNPEAIAYVCLDDTAHFPMLEDPETYRHCLDAFLGAA